MNQDEESNTHVVMPSEENVEEEMSDEKMHVVMPAVMDQGDRFFKAKAIII